MSTTDQDYQREYYQRNKAKRSRDLKWRWHNDPEFRRRERQRAKDRRALERAEKASGRFEAMVAAKRREQEKEMRKRAAARKRKRRRKGDTVAPLSPTNTPRIMVVEGKEQQVSSTGSLGREVGRSARAIRDWLREGVLPGASVYVDGVAWFTKPFCAAVYRACERLYYLDGRGTRVILKRLVREELKRAGVKWVTD